MYEKLAKLSKKLYSLDLKKEAQEILILEGVDPAEILSALGLPEMTEGHDSPCNLPNEEGEPVDAPDFEELMEKLFGDLEEKKED